VHKSSPGEPDRTQIAGSLIAIIAVLAIFCTKYMSPMLQRNAFWRSGAWYDFLTSPSAVSQASLLDPAAMAPYYRTLDISLGHQLIAIVNAWLGFEAGTAFLYVAIAAVCAVAVYLIALHFTGSRIKAFFIALLILNTDALALAHIGACGSAAQGPARDYLALGFILLAFYFLLESRFYRYSLCLYLGFLLHLPHGSYAFALLLPLTVLNSKNPRFLGFHIASFAFTALGLYAYQSAGAVPVGPEVRELWFKWVYIFNGGHIFFDHSIGYLTPNFAFLSVVLAGVAIGATSPEHRSLTLSIVLVWILIALTATVFIYVIPIMLVYQLTPYRSSLLVSTILLILLVQLFLDRCSLAMPAWKTLLALIGLIAVMSGTFFGICLSAAVGCLILGIESRGRTRVTCLAAALGCLLFLGLCMREYTIYDAYFVGRDYKAWMLAMAVMGTLAIARRLAFTPAPIRRIAVPVAAAAVLLLAASTPSRYVAGPTRESIDRLDDFLKVSRLIQERTTEREAVLTAPLIDMPMLEVTGGRASIGQLVKAHIPYLAPALLPVFDRTLRSFGLDIPAFRGNWLDLLREAPGAWRKAATIENLRELGARHNAHLVLTEHDHELALEPLYRGPHFTLYRLAP